MMMRPRMSQRRRKKRRRRNGVRTLCCRRSSQGILARSHPCPSPPARRFAHPATATQRRQGKLAYSCEHWGTSIHEHTFSIFGRRLRACDADCDAPIAVKVVCPGQGRRIFMCDWIRTSSQGNQPCSTVLDFVLNKTGHTIFSRKYPYLLLQASLTLGLGVVLVLVPGYEYYF